MECALYVLGDPYERVAIAKVGISVRPHSRWQHIFSQCPRRRAFLPDGFSVHGCYVLRSVAEAKLLETALLRAFPLTDKDTQGWLAVRPSRVNLVTDVFCECLGLEYRPLGSSFVRWSD